MNPTCNWYTILFDKGSLRFQNKKIFFLFLLFFLVIDLSGNVYAGNSTQLVVTESGAFKLKVNDSSLVNILTDISAKTGIKIYGDSSILNERITADLTDLTAEELLKKILDKYNFAFVFSSKDLNNGNPKSVRLKEAWIFPDGKKGGGAPLREISARQEIYGYHPPEAISVKPDVTGFEQNLKLRDLQAVDTQDPANIPALLNLLKDPNQSVRLAAMDTLSNFGPLIPVDQLVKIAFNHEDPQVRIAVLGMGIDIPNEAIVDHALHDPSPQVRLEALQILGGSGDVEEVARHALNDEDPSVQDVAREILRGIAEENSGLPPEEAEGIQMLDGQQEGEQ